jgi:hypothetical protein
MEAAHFSEMGEQMYYSVACNNLEDYQHLLWKLEIYVH